ncbi:hypothetical protein CI238_06267, partial [Colletotrichum incanum]
LPKRKTEPPPRETPAVVMCHRRQRQEMVLWHRRHHGELGNGEHGSCTELHRGKSLKDSLMRRLEVVLLPLDVDQLVSTHRDAFHSRVRVQTGFCGFWCLMKKYDASVPIRLDVAEDPYALPICRWL